MQRRAACRNQPIKIRRKTGDTTELFCPRCGDCSLSDAMEDRLLEELQPRQRALVSGWLREQSEAGVRPLLSRESLERALQIVKPTLKERCVGS
jgi:dissimilatory sulfite reductase (desulfoviridin) alpha/beta subunit